MRQALQQAAMEVSGFMQARKWKFCIIGELACHAFSVATSGSFRGTLIL